MTQVNDESCLILRAVCLASRGASEADLTRCHVPTSLQDIHIESPKDNDVNVVRSRCEHNHRIKFLVILNVLVR